MTNNNGYNKGGFPLWSAEDLALMIELGRAGAKVREIQARLSEPRTLNAIYYKLTSNGIYQRGPNSNNRVGRARYEELCVKPGESRTGYAA